MINVQQWRVRIGYFAGGKSSTPAASRDVRTMVTTPRSWYGITFAVWL